MQTVAAINNDRYLTEAEVSHLTGRAKSTLAKDRFYRRGITFYKIGRSVRYKYIDVIEFMDQHRVDTEPN
jgi:predicted DNA-binding transcriptional regulator AlpA